MNMDAKNILKYAELMRDMELTAFELKCEDVYVRMERNLTFASNTAPAPVQPAAAAEPAAQPQNTASDETEITSPMVGMFYTAPAENADPFVQVGTKVHSGDVLCIIEAMKLMNEIVADSDGVITEVLVANGTVVEFGQPLFRLRKEQ